MCAHQLGQPNAMQSACPKCGAIVGKPCYSPAKQQTPPHKARRLAYRSTMEKHFLEMRKNPVA